MATSKGKSNARGRSGAAASRGRRSQASGRSRQASGASGRSSRGQSARGRSSRTSRESRQNAVALLKSDHRQVEEWFEQFEKARGDDRKRDLAGRICQALKAHTSIEEEIFYPAFAEATGDEDMHHEAIVEHDGAKKLIAEIEGSGPEDELYDARVSVLSEMIKHHVNEEEKRDGMFAKARSSDMDLEALGQRLLERKQELMGEGAPSTGRGLMAGLSRLTSRDEDAMRR